MKCPFKTITINKHSEVDRWGKHEIIDTTETDFKDCSKSECPYFKRSLNMNLQIVEKCSHVQGE